MKHLQEKVFAFLLASLLAATAFAQQAPSIMNIGSRQTTSLDGQWKTIVDPFENGYYDYRLKQTNCYLSPATGTHNVPNYTITKEPCGIGNTSNTH